MRRFALLSCILMSWSCGAFELIAHRANAHGAPENSVAGVKASWASGADVVEIDVRVSQDRVVYLFHDDEIDGVPVSGLTYAEIGDLTSEERVPRLEFVLDIDGGAGHYLLDLKSPTFEGVEKLAQVISSGRFPVERVIIQSDNLEVLGRAASMLPDCQYFYLDRLRRAPPFYLRPSSEQIIEKIAGIDIHGVSIKGRRYLDVDYVASLKTAGLKVYVWTINNSGRVKYYRRIGADGVISDLVEDLRKNTIRN